VKVLVCGGRDYTDWGQFLAVMEALHAQEPITTVIHGAYLGADELAERWARLRQIDFIGCPAKWGLLDRKAGPIRNTHMLEYRPDLVVAFPGGKGTADMTNKARAAGIEVKAIVA
jgi:hypothetical protein